MKVVVSILLFVIALSKLFSHDFDSAIILPGISISESRITLYDEELHEIVTRNRINGESYYDFIRFNIVDGKIIERVLLIVGKDGNYLITKLNGNYNVKNIRLDILNNFRKSVGEILLDRKAISPKKDDGLEAPIAVEGEPDLFYIKFHDEKNGFTVEENSRILETCDFRFQLYLLFRSMLSSPHNES